MPSINDISQDYTITLCKFNITFYSRKLLNVKIFEAYCLTVKDFMHLNLQDLITKIGYFGVWAIIFAESGLLIGFFL
ncbi:MAG: hypothetical protein ACYTXC_07670, partial [Nostoc sp.]